METIHLIGAGGHGAVVLDAMLSSGIDRGRIVVHDAHGGRQFMGFDVVAPEFAGAEPGHACHVAVGSPAVRERLYGEAGKLGIKLFTVLHPRAVIADTAELGLGVFVAAGAIVAPHARIAMGTIVNHAAIVDHDVEIGEVAHIAPSATLGGGVTIGARALIGAGACVLPLVRVGDDAVIGAGATVLRNVPAGEAQVGNPARRMDR